MSEKECKHKFVRVYRSTLPERQCIFCGLITSLPVFNVSDLGSNIQSTI